MSKHYTVIATSFPGLRVGAERTLGTRLTVIAGRIKQFALFPSSLISSKGRAKETTMLFEKSLGSRPR